MADIVISILVFAVAIITHELAHGWAAYRLGDNSAKDAGRLTLNPLAHMDPVGTVVLPFLLVASRSPVIFGWAKPVPVDPSNFKHPRIGLLITSFAGPAANLALAVFFASVFKAGIFPKGSLPAYFLVKGAVISLVLGFFNLIPVPPLDGANILLSVLPRGLARVFADVERYGFIILIILLYAGLLNKIIIPMVSFTLRLFFR